MISKSKASQIADEVVAAGIRDRAQRASFFATPVPRWFQGPHLVGLSVIKRRERYDEMSKRALKRPGWVLISLAIIAVMLVVALYLARLPISAIATCPAVVVLMVRHYALRSQLKRDVSVFESEARRTATPDL
jgi:hypothetical protein